MKSPSSIVLLFLFGSAFAAPAPPQSIDDIENAPVHGWKCGKNPLPYTPEDIVTVQHYAVSLQNAGETKAPSGKHYSVLSKSSRANRHFHLGSNRRMRLLPFRLGERVMTNFS